jgi:hypothetical protein
MTGVMLVVPKVADQQEVGVAKAMAVDGQVERAIHRAEGAVMRLLAVAKSRYGAALA